MSFVFRRSCDFMSLRPYLDTLKQSNLLVEVHDKVKLDYEISDYLISNNNKAVLFSNVEDSSYPLIGNSLSSRNRLKLVLEEKDDYYKFFQQSLLNPQQPELVESSLIFSNKESVNLSNLPIPKFFPADGGNYLTSGIVIAQFPDTNAPNMSIHRIMVLNDHQGAIRIVPRNLHKIFFGPE